MSGFEIDKTKESLCKKEFSQSQEEYFKLYNTAPIGIIKATSAGNVLNLNQKMAQIAGYNNAEQAIKNLNNLAAEFYVNSKKRDEFLKKLKSQGKIENFEYQARKKEL